MDKFKQKMIEYGETKRFKGPFKEGTMKTYMSNLRLAMDVVGAEMKGIDEFMDWTKDSQGVFQKFKDSGKSPKTLLNYNASIVNALQVLDYPKEIYQPYQLYRVEAEGKINTEGLTKKQKEVMSKVSREDIISFLDSEFHNEPYDRLMKLILKIHVHYPFRNELADMKWIRRKDFVLLTPEDQKKNNWITIGNYNYSTKQHKLQFIKTNYKTDKRYGNKLWDVIPEVVDEIYDMPDKFIPNLSEDARYLTGVLTGKPFIQTQPFLPKQTTIRNGQEKVSDFSRNMLSRHLGEFTTKHLGQPISTTLMAKYFGTKAKDPLNPTPEEVKAIIREADIRGHSIKTKLTIYNV